MPDTIFTKIINKEIPAKIALETETVLAFYDINPQAPVHILIIPKKQIPTVNDIAPTVASLIADMIAAAQKLAKELGIADKGYRLVMNCNQDGGQEVYHLHMHLLGGRKMQWPPG
ncbi:Purine nucleoside phosphoramidase [Candidatus Brocadiaceae bacterium]|nr:Purine nucleoside phosphoramidase [Candidatus Brocadiaceae bacterium]